MPGFQLDWDNMISFALRITAVLICIIIHEVSHGLAAYWLGDPTAKQNHRLSLNPIRHIDPFGLLMMIAVGFGWAKPVPVDARYFKKPKSGMAITAFAGPLSNFLLAFFAAMILQFLIGIMLVRGEIDFLINTTKFLETLIFLSLGLGIFNLIPFPPLDGSKILGIILPERLYFSLMRYEQYGIFLLMAALWFGWLDGPLRTMRILSYNLFYHGAEFMRTAVVALLR